MKSDHVLRVVIFVYKTSLIASWLAFEKVSNSNSSFTIAASSSIDLRKSVAPYARYTFSITISDIIPRYAHSSNHT